MISSAFRHYQIDVYVAREIRWDLVVAEEAIVLKELSAIDESHADHLIGYYDMVRPVFV
jgi:hypothetical protein